MNQLLRPCLLSALAALPFLTSPASQEQRAQSPPSAAQEDAARNPLMGMGWLAGSWSGSMWGGTFEAYYSTPQGGRILSHSRLMADGKQRFYEFEVFEVVDQIARLHPHPGGQPADGFELVDLDLERRFAVFENPEKDYPTRIRYERLDENRLHITLSDPFGESEKQEVFKLAR